MNPDHPGWHPVSRIQSRTGAPVLWLKPRNQDSQWMGYRNAQPESRASTRLHLAVCLEGGPPLCVAAQAAENPGVRLTRTKFANSF